MSPAAPAPFCSVLADSQWRRGGLFSSWRTQCPSCSACAPAPWPVRRSRERGPPPLRALPPQTDAFACGAARESPTAFACASAGVAPPKTDAFACGAARERHRLCVRFRGRCSAKDCCLCLRCYKRETPPLRALLLSFFRQRLMPLPAVLHHRLLVNAPHIVVRDVRIKTLSLPLLVCFTAPSVPLLVCFHCPTSFLTW